MGTHAGVVLTTINDREELEAYLEDLELDARVTALALDAGGIARLAFRLPGPEALARLGEGRPAATDGSEQVMSVGTLRLLRDLSESGEQAWVLESLSIAGSGTCLHAADGRLQRAEMVFERTRTVWTKKRGLSTEPTTEHYQEIPDQAASRVAGLPFDDLVLEVR